MTRRAMTRRIPAEAVLGSLVVLAGCGRDLASIASQGFPRPAPAGTRLDFDSAMQARVTGKLEGVGVPELADRVAFTGPESVSEATERRPVLGFNSAVSALAAGRFEGVSIPEPTREATLAEPDPIPESPERRPVLSLEQARARALEDLASKNAHLRFVAAGEAGRLRIEEAVPLLAKLVHRGDAAQLPAVSALGRIGGERPAKVLAKALGRAKDARLKLAILRALGATRAAAARRPLEKQLLGGKTMFRIEAAGALSALGMREAVPALKAAMMRRDFQPVTRLAAAAALAKLGDPAGVGALDQAAAESSPVLQGFALSGMAALVLGPATAGEGEAESIRARAARSVAAAVGSPYEEVWSEAMKVLALARPRGAPAVLQALERGDPEVARRARVARAAWGGDGAQQTLVVALRSPIPRLRAAACGIMGTLGDPSATEHLAGALSDPSEAVRASAAWALAAVGGDAAMEALERAADGSDGAEDVQLRGEAARALSAVRAREGAEAGKPRRRTTQGTGGTKAADAGPVLEQILTGAEGKLLCTVRGPDGETRMLSPGDEAGAGWRVERILPDPGGRGGGKVVLSKGTRTLEIRR